MRILITSDIFPPDVGGPATYVPRIAAELTRRGHDIKVVTYSRSATDPEDARCPFLVVRIPLLPPQWRRILRIVTTISRYGRDVDVIYVNGLVTETVLANGLLRKPLVAKVVGDLAWERSRDKGWIQDDIETFQMHRYAPWVELMRWRRTWTYRHMHHIVVPSSYLRDMLLQYWRLPSNRISVIYNALEPITEEAPPELLPLTTQRKIITVCRLTGWKGVDGLIELLPALPDAGLVVVGNGPLRRDLEQQARDLGVRERVLFAGTVPRERIVRYLKACDVFVLNSTYEGLPHVVLEAMAAGLPVVAADTGGTKELVVHGLSGLLVPPRDSRALAQAVARLLDHPDEAATLVAGSREILTRFSPTEMIDETESVLATAAGGRG